MDREKFIWCRNCDAVHHVTPLDKAANYDSAGNMIEDCPDDWRRFMSQHERHRLEPLWLINGRYYPKGSSWDPMQPAFLEVGNDRERLLLRQSRSTIDEPLRFEAVGGRIVEQGVTLVVQEDAIKKEMKLRWESSAQRLDDAQVDLFVGIFKEMIREMKPEDFELSGPSHDDDRLFFGVLEQRMIDKLMVMCAKYFLIRELADIRRFVDTHIHDTDVMSVMVHRRIAVEQLAR